VRKLLILLSLVALLAAGCGGGGSSSESKPLTKQEYQAQLEQTAKEIGDKVGKTQNDIGKMSDADLKQFADVVHEFADRLDKINPPTEVAGEHKRLVQAMNDLGDEFPDVAKKLKTTKDPSEAISLLFGMKAIGELIKLGSDFKAKGYNLKLNG
jgi:hypothetical protein